MIISTNWSTQLNSTFLDFNLKFPSLYPFASMFVIEIIIKESKKINDKIRDYIYHLILILSCHLSLLIV